MHGEEFVKRLEKMAPSKEDLEKLNLPGDFINQLIGRYYCKARDKVDNFANSFFTDVILMLLKQYDCSDIEIGILTFLPEVIEEIDYYQIGRVEVDILAINKVSLQIEVLDYANPDYVIWKCAANSHLFLEALLVCADFSSSIVKNIDLSDDKNYTLIKVDECTEVAGGEEYRNFYEMLLGYW